MDELLSTLSAVLGMPKDVVAGWLMIGMAVVIGGACGLFDDRRRK